MLRSDFAVDVPKLITDRVLLYRKRRTTTLGYSLWVAFLYSINYFHAGTVPPSIGERFEAAWGGRDGFMAIWKSRIPQAITEERAGPTDGLSAVGKMRASGPASDPMSSKTAKIGDGEDPSKKLNKWFNKWIDENRK